MKKISALFLLFSGVVAAEVQFSGSVGIEQRVYIEDALYPQQSRTQISAMVQPELFIDITDDSNIVFKPFARLDEADSERTHADIRELLYSHYFNNVEVRAGIGKVFWGQTESLHLVDIINQTDAIEAIDGEDKLGQPMLDVRYLSDFGTFSAFYLPYFRERTFSGVDGRLRPIFAIQQNDALYESDNEDSNPDWAVRWQSSIGSWELGLSYFDGTSRRPDIVIQPVEGSPIPQLVPKYNLLTQAGLDALYVAGSWLLKLEAIHSKELGESYVAAVSGFEYTVVDVMASGYDLGLLMEYQYDEREDFSFITGQNDLMFGARLQLNDMRSTSVLFGVVQDLDYSKSQSVFIEGSARINQNLTLEIEGYFFGADNDTDPLYIFRRDDHVNLKMNYYF